MIQQEMDEGIPDDEGKLMKWADQVLVLKNLFFKT
jgi:hypothetical protein